MPTPDLSVLLVAWPAVTAGYVVFGMVGFGTTLVALPVIGTYWNLPLLVLAACLAPAIALGLYLGHRITLKLDRVRFMRVLYGVLLVTGASLLFRALS